MLVTLTEELIAEAIPKDCNACVLALALQQHFPDAWISVEPGEKFGTVTIVEDDKAKEAVYRLTRKANRIASDFDEGVLVEPQDLEIWE